MNDRSDAARMKALEDRIAKAKAAGKPAKPHQDEHYSQAQVAWRMVIELVAGLGIGFGIGYGLDWMLGTMPVFLVLFILLGFAAGVQTMMRTAAEVQRTRQQDAARGKPDQGED